MSDRLFVSSYRTLTTAQAEFMVPLEERDQSKDEGLDERTILKWIFQNWNGDME